MKLRQLKYRAQEMHGHYQVHSYRQGYDDFGSFLNRPPTRRELLETRRVRVGISHARAWRQHV